MDLYTLTLGSTIAIVTILLIEWGTRKIRPPEVSSDLARDLYQGGESISARKRRYLEKTFAFAALFTILHVIYFMIASYSGTLQSNGTTDALSPTMSIYLVVVLCTIVVVTRTEWGLPT